MEGLVELLIGGVFLTFGIFLLLIIIDAKAKSKIRSFVLYAKDGIEKDFTSNHKYGYCSAKGIKVKKDENGKIIIQSQSKLINPTFIK